MSIPSAIRPSLQHDCLRLSFLLNQPKAARQLFQDMLDGKLDEDEAVMAIDAMERAASAPLAQAVPA